MSDYIRKAWACTGPQTLSLDLPEGVWGIDRIRFYAASGWSGSKSAVITRRHEETYKLDEALKTVSLSSTAHSFIPTVDAGWLETPALFGQPKGQGETLEIAVSCGAGDVYYVEAILFKLGVHRTPDVTRVESP